MEASKEEKELKLFPTLCEGDIKVKKVKKRVVALLGNSRGGKSTASHWLLGRSLIGERKYGRIIYVNQADGA